MVIIDVEVQGMAGVRDLLDGMQRRIDNPGRLLGVLADRWSRWEQELFESEGAAGMGQRWAPLSPRYAAWKAGRYGSRSILQREGRLFSAAVGPEKVIDRQSARLRIRHRAARFHQAGTSRMPARPIVYQPTEGDKQEMSKLAARWVVDGEVF